MRPASLLCPALAALLAACGVEGALGQAALDGTCEGDPACLDDLADGPLAAGGTVEVLARLETGGAAVPPAALIAADEEVIKVAGNQLTGAAPGMSAVLLLDEDGVALDFFHIFVAEPDRLELHRLGGVGAGSEIDGDLELLVGDELTLGAVPYRGPQRLVGSGASVWSSSSAAAAVLADGSADRRRLVARGEGIVEITVESMGVARSLTVAIYP
jgi:hypothetical protein